MSAENPRPSSSLPRRDLLKLGAAGLGFGAASAATPSLLLGRPGDGPAQVPPLSGQAPVMPLAAPPLDVVRMGFVGVGLQGGSHVRNFLKIDGVEIVALCDVNEARNQEVAAWVVEAGHPAPRLYGRTPTDFVRMCETEDLDLVFSSTPWEWHVPACVAAMENGSHAATEVPAAYTLEDCWKLVEVAEAREKHCVMMENCNYDRPEMLVFHMARLGMFGEILHAECGYNHDLRAIKFEDRDEGLWRRWHATQRNANLYPTHGLGPVANVMDINRGDQFATLVSMSSPSRGLQDWREAHVPAGDPKWQERYVLGDVNVSLIKTVQGRTIYVTHDTNLPRPYTRIHMVQGTRGIFQGYPNRVYVEGRSPSHRWEEMSAYLEEFDHPLWKDLEEMSRGAGHGGMDFIEDYRLIKCLREGLPTDMNVYDAAALSAVGPLSEWSVANGSQPAAFPDFTRGRWREWPRLELFRA